MVGASLAPGCERGSILLKVKNSGNKVTFCKENGLFPFPCEPSLWGMKISVRVCVYMCARMYGHMLQVDVPVMVDHMVWLA